MILKLALDFLVELLHSISQERQIRTRVLDLQLARPGGIGVVVAKSLAVKHLCGELLILPN
jgi:hypothetical protein